MPIRMDALDVIERRIETLEAEILPKTNDFDYNKSQAIVDLLTETQTMISSALSCRNLITTTIESLSNLHSYLDPTNEESELEIELKRQYLLEVSPEIRDRLKIVGKFKKLLPYTNSEYLLKVGELTDKLEQLTVDNLEAYEQCREVTNKVLNALEKYNCIITSIKIIFSQLDRVVCDLEEALKPKLPSEE